jgi:transcriptional regulator with XRE-family HTH domain
MSWLDNLKELKKKSNKSSKQIAEGTLMPERTVVRIFNGETANPSITTLIPIINFLGGSFDEIFADTKAIVGDQTLATLKEDNDVITAERDTLISDNKILTEKVAVLSKELEMTNLKLMYTEKLLATHELYNKLKPNK